MQRSRRALLALASATLGASLAGCASTEPAQSTATQQPVLELTSSVVAQSSAEEPTRIAATLTNAGSGTVSVGFGPTLLFSDNGPGEELASPDPLVIDDTQTLSVSGAATPLSEQSTQRTEPGE
ncbi:hypothetical protein BRC96_02045 [Halobacteriales archaeon QS_6_64_34]|nr:MAG: hypothetical protein BRC96_02045 [Halobacteriales archaeon QS_6_64_34]